MQVSLITCTRNSEKTIKNCCLSISSQTYDNIEHVISDKNSKDKIFRATKNIPNVKCTDIGHFSAYDILKFKKMDLQIQPKGLNDFLLTICFVFLSINS